MAIPSIAASTLVAAACALQFASTAHSEVGTVPVPRDTLQSANREQPISWQHAPGKQDESVFVNKADVYNCGPLLDTWRAGQPTGPGYCSKIAWSSDNPAYNVYGAPTLQNVIDEVGDC